jgi:hypothetical protein
VLFKISKTMKNWVPTDRSEMRAFIGVMMAMGLLKKPTIESYWNKGGSFLLYSPSFSQVFSRNRFQNILRFLHCNDNTQAAPRGSPEYDPGYKIRPIITPIKALISERSVGTQFFILECADIGC